MTKSVFLAFSLSSFSVSGVPYKPLSSSSPLVHNFTRSRVFFELLTHGINDFVLEYWMRIFSTRSDQGESHMVLCCVVVFSRPLAFFMVIIVFLFIATLP